MAYRNPDNVEKVAIAYCISAILLFFGIIFFTSLGKIILMILIMSIALLFLIGSIFVVTEYLNEIRNS